MFRHFIRYASLLIVVTFLGMGCDPQSTSSGDDDDDSNSMATVEGSYLVTSFAIVEGNGDALDIDGDNQADNNLESALGEVTDFVGDYVGDYVSIPGVSGTVTKLLNSVLSVDTLNTALAEAIGDEPWLVMISPPGGGPVNSDENAYVSYYVGYQEYGDTEYYATDEMGTQVGSYDDESTIIDAYGDEMLLTVTIIYGDTYFQFPFNLHLVRSYMFYNEEYLTEAKLAGAISVTALLQVVTDMLDYVEDVTPGANLDELEADIYELMLDDDVSDISYTNSSGEEEKAVSVSFILDAESAVVVEYY